MFVYLCPSFDTGSCSGAFVSLDQTCSPASGARAGSCYDTGFEVSANHSYGLASCTSCGGGCGTPGGFTTPPGFTLPNYYSGITWACGAPCTAPPDCGGPAEDAGVGVTRCSTADCWLSALSLQQNGQDVPLVIVDQPALSTSTQPADLTPGFTSFEGKPVSLPVDGGAAPSVALTVNSSAEFEYDFRDPNGCSPGICFSIPTCPKDQRCAIGSKVACARPKRDGALTGTVHGTLTFRAEPADPTQSAELELTVQLVSAPTSDAGSTCDQIIDADAPLRPKLGSDALVSAPVVVDVTIKARGGSAGLSDADGGAPTGSTDASAGDASSENVCCCDFRSDEMWHCTHSLRSGALCNVPWPDCCTAAYTVCE